MLVSVESKSNLERCLTVSIPGADIEKEVESELKKLAQKASIKGFRPGKVPKKIIEERYSESVRQDVIFGNLMNKVLTEALKESQLEPITAPEIDLKEPPKPGETVEFTATFEISPTVDFASLADITIEKEVADISELDIDTQLEAVRKTRVTWEEITRPAQEGDRLVLDFKGMMDGEPLERGEAENFTLILGSNSLIAGFETGLLGASAGEERTLSLVFPDNYHVATLAGRPVEFSVKIHQVETSQLPTVDEAFVKSFDIDSGDITALRQQIREQLQKEAEVSLKNQQHSRVIDKLLEKYVVELPPRMLKKTIEQMAHQVVHANEQHHHHEHDEDHEHHHDLTDEQRLVVEERAHRRLTTDLLFASYVKQNQLVLDQDKVFAEMRKMAESFEDPAAIYKWMLTQEGFLNTIRSRVFEEQVVEHLLSKMQVTEKLVPFKDIKNPAQ